MQEQSASLTLMKKLHREITMGLIAQLPPGLLEGGEQGSIGVIVENVVSTAFEKVQKKAIEENSAAQKARTEAARQQRKIEAQTKRQAQKRLRKENQKRERTQPTSLTAEARILVLQKARKKWEDANKKIATQYQKLQQFDSSFFADYPPLHALLPFDITHHAQKLQNLFQPDRNFVIDSPQSLIFAVLLRTQALYLKKIVQDLADGSTMADQAQLNQCAELLQNCIDDYQASVDESWLMKSVDASLERLQHIHEFGALHYALQNLFGRTAQNSSMSEDKNLMDPASSPSDSSHLDSDTQSGSLTPTSQTSALNDTMTPSLTPPSNSSHSPSPLRGDAGIDALVVQLRDPTPSNSALNGLEILHGQNAAILLSSPRQSTKDPANSSAANAHVDSQKDSPLP